MIIGEKKYGFSKGLAFYSELESQRFSKELEEGWLLDKISMLGYYRFQKVQKEEAQIIIDFYPGKKIDKKEYLDLYEAAGWQELLSYRQRYFVFKASLEAPEIYSDEESFNTRLMKEIRWFFLNVFEFFILSGLGLYVLNITAIKEFVQKIPFIYEVLYFIGLMGLLFPLSGAVAFLYFRIIYKKRSLYYKTPNKYANKQRFIRDMLWLMLLGALIGGVIGFCYGFFI